MESDAHPSDPCACGCGGWPASPQSRYVRGHQHRRRWWPLAHSRDPEAVCIPLGGGQYATIDADDLPMVRDATWSPARRGDRTYAVAQWHGRTVLLHRLLLWAPAGVPVRIIDGDGLNCRRANLRLGRPPRRRSTEKVSLIGTSLRQGDR